MRNNTIKIPDNNLVSASWLQENIGQNKLRLLFTQMANPFGIDPLQTQKKFIPHSILFDFEHVFCDKTSSLPHTMPSAEVFTREAQKLGINSDGVIVVYDAQGIYCAPRVWWMFKSMGHPNVFVLNGGLPDWITQGLPISETLTLPNALGDFIARYQDRHFVDSTQILSKKNKINLIDARSAGRFNGTSAEPRKGLRSGHIPGSINLPFDRCLGSSSLKTSTELKEIFYALPMINQRELVFSCGSGVTACVLALAASEVGYKNISVYDGSWSEWGSRDDLPITVC